MAGDESGTGTNNDPSTDGTVGEPENAAAGDAIGTVEAADAPTAEQEPAVDDAPPASGDGEAGPAVPGGARSGPGSKAKAAIIYLPGLGTDHTADRALAIARRIERALDRSAASAAATFETTTREVDIGDNRQVQVSSIERRENKDADLQPGIDVYHLNYRQVLRGRFERATLPERLYFLFVATLWATGQILRHPFKPLRNGGIGLSTRDRVQVAYAVFGLVCLYVYLGVLVAAAVASVGELVDVEQTGIAQEEPAPSDDPDSGNASGDEIDWPGTPRWVAWVWDKTPGHEAIAGFWSLIGNGGVWLGDFVVAAASWARELLDDGVSQSIIVYSVLAGLLIPRIAILRDRMTEAAIDFLAVIQYMNVGTGRNITMGYLRDLVEYIMAENPDIPEREIHIVSYSFGGIVAIDAMVPFDNQPVARLDGVVSLATIGAPVEILRTYWPTYFATRVGRKELPRLWCNVFCPLDILSSQFGVKDDSKDGGKNDPLRGYPGPISEGIGIFVPGPPTTVWERFRLPTGSRGNVDGRPGPWTRFLSRVPWLRRSESDVSSDQLPEDVAAATSQEQAIQTAGGTVEGQSEATSDDAVDTPAGDQRVSEDAASEDPLTGPRMTSFSPTREIGFPFAERNRRLTWVEILTLTGFGAHTVYWESRDKAEYSAFDEVVPYIFAGSVSKVLE